MLPFAITAVLNVTDLSEDKNKVYLPRLTDLGHENQSDLK